MNSLYLIYQNAFELLKYRNAGKIINTPINNEIEFSTEFKKNDYKIVVKAELTQVIIVGKESASIKSNGLTKLFGSSGTIDRHSIFIVPTESDYVSIILHLQKLRMNSGKDVTLSGTPVIFEAEGASKYRIEINKYSTLIFNFPTYIAFTIYEQFNQDQFEIWSKTYNKKPTSLPVVFSTDVCIFWKGYKHGDYVIEKKNSPTAGEAMILKRVVNNISIRKPREKKSE